MNLNKIILLLLNFIYLTKTANIQKCCKNDSQIQQLKNENGSDPNKYKCSDNKTNCLKNLCIDKVNNENFLILKCLNNSFEETNLNFIPSCCTENFVYNQKTKNCSLDQNGFRQLIRNKSFENDFIFRKNKLFDCPDGVVIDILLKDLNFDENQIFLENNIDFPNEKVPPNLNLNLNQTCATYLKNSSNIVLTTCVTKNWCRDKTCIRKCCPSGEAYMKPSIGKAKCVKMNNFNMFNPFSFIKDPFEIDSNFGLIHSEKCSLKRKLLTKDQAKFLPNGSLLNQKNGKIFTSIDNGYCIEKYYAIENSFFQSYHFENGSEVAIICEKDSKTSSAALNIILYSSMITSVIFLLLTLLIYILLPELRNRHGKIVMGHVTSMLFAYVTLCTIKVPRKTQFASNECAILAYIINFWFLATFSWLNVMCFDIWHTFGIIRSSSIVRHRDKKFLWYCAYAFAVPTFFTTCLILGHTLEGLPNFLRPFIGKTRCFYDHEAIWARLVYFILPIALQLISNLIFFGLTVRYYFKVKVNVMKMNDAQRKKSFMADKKTFITVLKLSSVMGLTWIAEVVSSLLQPNWFLQFFDIMNALQGVLIFLIFLLKPRVLKNLKRIFLKNPQPFETTETNATNISASKISGISNDRKDLTEMSDFLNNKRKTSVEKGF